MGSFDENRTSKNLLNAQGFLYLVEDKKITFPSFIQDSRNDIQTDIGNYRVNNILKKLNIRG